MASPILSIQKLSLDETQKFSQDDLPFPAYFVASTAPINVEDQQSTDISDPQALIDEISQYLNQHKGDAEILIVIHGYNTSRIGVKKWFESIYRHLAARYSKSRSKGLLLIGYRWPSEKIVPDSSEAEEAGSSFRNKRQSAKKALPVILDKVSRWGTIGFIGGMVGSVASIVMIALQASNSVIFLIIFLTLTILSLVAIAPILTILIFRLIAYFRDAYRATNFGVPDLVELIRQIDKNLMDISSSETQSAKENSWENQRIKLSFIGHSMGGFVVTNTVRILSDVFDSRSVGSIDANHLEKNPSRSIGHVFALGRLVLVSPDIPSETIISGRANFLQSSLRRFEEAYLFSNEGDMALRLASTAANYFSYPSGTQAGGYRLGNVTVRNSVKRKKTGVTATQESLLEEATLLSESYGIIARRRNNGNLVRLKDGQEIPLPDKTYPLDYLYIRNQTPLSKRQGDIALAPFQKPIGEFFTFFDCTDYTETYLDHNGQEKTVGLVSHARRKQALSFRDYVSLTIDYFSGKIDTHGGYFSNGQSDRKRGVKPEAAFTKLAIYGLACVGFERFLVELVEEPVFNDYKVSFEQILKELKPQFLTLTANQQDAMEEVARKVALSQALSSICRDKSIQVLLAQELSYTVDILEERTQAIQDEL